MVVFRRLKQRLAFYLLVSVIFMLLWKLFRSDPGDCASSLHKRHIHEDVVDTWNLNDHHVHATQYSWTRASPSVATPLSKFNSEWGPHQLGIIVPHRNRFEELREFVPYMHEYLNEKKINHKILIINQVDNHRFNRASLINIGFQLALNESCDYIAMHDVDLLPLNKDLNYEFPDLGPFHVAAPHLHPKYHYEKFVGGILLLSVKQFEDLNGLSNKFWGWGREDDEFYMRIVDSGYMIFRHGEEIKTGYDTFRHIHGPERPRDYKSLPGQKKAKFSRDTETGLSTLQYKLIRKQRMTVDDYPFIVADVKLHCDYEVTPWCDLPKKKKS